MRFLCPDTAGRGGLWHGRVAAQAQVRNVDMPTPMQLFIECLLEILDGDRIQIMTALMQWVYQRFFDCVKGMFSGKLRD